MQNYSKNVEPSIADLREAGEHIEELRSPGGGWGVVQGDQGPRHGKPGGGGGGTGQGTSSMGVARNVGGEGGGGKGRWTGEDEVGDTVRYGTGSYPPNER